MTWISGPCDPATRTLYVVPNSSDRELLLLASCEVGYRSRKPSVELEPPAKLRRAETPPGDARSPKILRLVEPSDVERDRELFAVIAATAPGVISRLGLLVAELADVELAPEQMRGLAGHMHRLGDTFAMRADRLTIDGG